MEPGLPVAQSDSAELPDRRSGQRYTLILRAGKLVCDAGEFLCVLRDVSDKGLKARLFHPLPPAQTYQIELGGGERFAIEPVWSRGCSAGFRFSHGPVDVHTLLAEAGPFPKRHIRLCLAANLPIRLRDDDGERCGRIRDISQHGAQIEVAGGLALGQQLRLEGVGLPVLLARVRWRRGNAYGVVFQQGFRLDELAALVAQLQICSRTAIATARGT